MKFIIIIIMLETIDKINIIRLFKYIDSQPLWLRTIYNAFSNIEINNHCPNPVAITSITETSNKHHSIAYNKSNNIGKGPIEDFCNHNPQTLVISQTHRQTINKNAFFLSGFLYSLWKNKQKNNKYSTDILMSLNIRNITFTISILYHTSYRPLKMKSEDAWIPIYDPRLLNI